MQFLMLLLKFTLVNQVGIVVYIGLAHWMTTTWKANKYLATGVGFFVGLVPNYILNRIWTFGSKDPNIPVQYGKYVLVAVVGFFLNHALLVLFLEVFRMKFLTAKLVGIFLVIVFCFVLNYWLTFTDVRV